MSNDFRVVRYTSTKPQTLSDASKEISKSWLDLAANSAKLVAVLSPAVGLFLLVSYLRAVGAPMLTLDSSTILTFLLMIGGYTFLSFFLIALIYMPVFTCYIKLRTRDLIKTRYGKIHCILRKVRFLQTFKGRRYNDHKNEFIVFHASSVATMICLATASLLNLPFEMVIYLIIITVFLVC